MRWVALIPLIFVSLLWVMLLARVIVYYRSSEIAGNWTDHRCEIPVMFTAAMYNTDPTKSAFEFATENFTYCTQQIAKNVLQTAFAPISSIASGLLDGADQSIQGVNIMSSMASTLFSGLTQIFQIVANRFQNTFLQLRSTLIRISAAMGRVHAAGIAAAYMGISTLQAFISAYNFVKEVIMIILGILLALLFLLFFALLPTIPLILAVIAAVGVGGGMASEFCFTGDTAVVMANGITKPIKNVQIGDLLLNNIKVTAVLELNGRGIPLYEYDGIRVSGSHLVKTVDGHWKQVKYTEIATQWIDNDRLYCLITNSRIIPIQGNTIIHEFRDYEEIAEDDHALQLWWDVAVNRSLNRVPIPFSATSVMNQYNENGFHPDTLILTVDNGLQPIKNIRLGDYIQTRDFRWTEVTGTIMYSTSSDWWLSDGGNDLIGSEVIQHSAVGWRRVSAVLGNYQRKPVPFSYHLFTTSGHFITAAGSLYRDAREHDGTIDAEYMQMLLLSLATAQHK